jgi:hypothetical protein
MVQLQPFPFLQRDLVPLSASLNPTKAGLVTQLKHNFAITVLWE